MASDGIGNGGYDVRRYRWVSGVVGVGVGATTVGVGGGRRGWVGGDVGFGGRRVGWGGVGALIDGRIRVFVGMEWTGMG